MRCKNCNKEVEDYKILCDECKKILREDSSRKTINEFESLVDERNEIDDLGKTKELTDISELINNKEIIDTNLDKTIVNEPVKLEENKINKKTITIISIVSFVVIILLIVLILVLNKSGVDTRTKKINYEKILNEYGLLLEGSSKKYIEENEVIPTWQKLNEIVNYDKYSIVCDIHDLYSDGLIYLNDCKIDGQKIKFTYGKKKVEQKQGTIINIYKNENDYTDKEAYGNELVGQVTCNNDCVYKIAFNKYVVFKENDGLLYLYDYEKDTKEFGPFDNYDIINERFIYYDDELYAIIYEENDIEMIYSLISNKTFKNTFGIIEKEDFNLFSKYGYIIFMNPDNEYQFISLKSGKIVFTLHNIIEYVEDIKNNLFYVISSYKEGSNKYYDIYNSNGKHLFDKEKISEYIITDDSFIFISNKKINIYDKNMKLKYASKDYNKIVSLYSNFAIVIDEDRIKIVNFKGEALFTYEEVWNDEKYVIDYKSITYEKNKISFKIHDVELDTIKTISYDFDSGKSEIS